MGDSLINAMPAFVDEVDSITKEGAPVDFLKNLASHAISNPLGRLGQAAKAYGRKTIWGKHVMGPQGLREALWRVTHPIQGMQKGWSMMGRGGRTVAPAGELTELGRIAQAVTKRKQKLLAAGKDPSKLPLFGEASAKHLLSRKDKAVPLLDIVRGTAKGVPANRAQALAEELSRRGWTGGGRVTKYLPMGSKGMTVGFAGAAVPGMLKAPPPSPEGEGSTIERVLRGAGDTAGFMLGGGLGFLPGMGVWYGAQKGGELLGRALDRYRAGGDPASVVRDLRGG